MGQIVDWMVYKKEYRLDLLMVLMMLLDFLMDALCILVAKMDSVMD